MIKLIEEDIICEGLTCGFQVIISPQTTEDDLSEELKKQILSDQKLRELIEKTITQLRNPKKKYSQVTKNIAIDVSDTLQKLLKESKK